jgi:hypothetical protein
MHCGLHLFQAQHLGRFVEACRLRFDGGMAPKHRPTPLSGGDRKALDKELSKARAMTGILAKRPDEKRRAGEALIREADNLACQSWNERMRSDGGPEQPSPTIGQAIIGGYPWLEVKYSRCRTPRSIDLTIMARQLELRRMYSKVGLTAASAARQSAPGAAF